MRDALLDPKTVDRLKAVRRYVESMDAEFPPEPLESDISGPIYGRVRSQRGKGWSSQILVSLVAIVKHCCIRSILTSVLTFISQLNGSLEYWKRRHFSTISWSAVEMLYSERQMKWFEADMDVPKHENTSIGKKEIADAKAKA